MLRQRSRRLFEMIGMIAMAILTVLGVMSLFGYSRPIVQAGQTTTNAAPPYLSYTGFARDADGMPLNGDYTLTFRIYDNIADLNAHWSEQHANVLIEHGYYNVTLGAVSPIDAALFADSDTFIGVTIANYGEMLPRQRLASVPFAILAHTSTSAENAIQAEHAIRADLATSAISATQAISATYASNSPFPEPDFDSDWFTMRSQQGVNSFREISHGLGSYPSHVKVLVRAVDGANLNYIFEGTGAAMADDDDNKNYQGLVFAYNENNVRLWAPDRSNSGSSGAILGLTDGWGGEVNSQVSHVADVRVLIWR